MSRKGVHMRGLFGRMVLPTASNPSFTGPMWGWLALLSLSWWMVLCPIAYSSPHYGYGMPGLACKRCRPQRARNKKNQNHTHFNNCCGGPFRSYPDRDSPSCCC